MIEGYPEEIKVKRKLLDYQYKMAKMAAEEQKEGYDRTATPSSIAKLGEPASVARVRGAKEGFSGGQRGGFGSANKQETDKTLGGKLLRIANAGSGKFFSDMAQFGNKLVSGMEEVEQYLNGGWTPDGKFVKGDSPIVSSLLGGVHNGANAVTEQANAELKRSASNWNSPAGRVFNEVAVNSVAAIPQAMLAFGTGGASTAGQLGAQTGTMEAALRGLAVDPRFWLAYGQNAGQSYAKAKAAGASENDALVSGTFSGLTGAMIDLGGGYENSGWINSKAASSGQIAKNLGKSVLEQSGEEYAKGVTSRLAEKAYRSDMPWYSVRDESAVFNPGRDAKQLAKDAATAAFMESAGYAVKRAGDGVEAFRQKRRMDDAPLTEEEFDSYFERGYNEEEDYEEWKQYSALLGSEAPGSFQEFQEIKYAAPEAYEELGKFYQYKLEVPSATQKDYEKYGTLTTLGVRGKVRVPPEPITVDALFFHDDHATRHGCSLDNAKEYVQNALCTVRRMRWDGESINYYSAKGATYIDVQTGEIKTAFSSQQFDPLTKTIVEVFQ